MTFSVVIPTVRRKTLQAAVRSAAWADQIVVVPGRSTFGNAQRDEGIDKATGDWICFMDDDDVFVREAPQRIRAALEGSDAPWHVFRMQYGPDGPVLWSDPEIRYGNVGTPMLVVPNTDQLPFWTRVDVYEADFHFALACQALLGEPAFHEDVIASIRPHENIGR